MHEYVFHALNERRAPAADAMDAFEDDAAAIRHGLSSAFPHGCDIWRGGHLVGRVCGPAESEPSADILTASTARAA